MIELLKLIPATAYVAFITALFTAGVTLLSVYLTNRGNTDRLKIQLEHDRSFKKEELYREQLEELYLLLEEWLSSLLTYYLPYMSVMKGELSYNDALDQTIDLGNSRKVNYKRLEMLIDIYFSEVKQEFALLLEKRSKAGDIMAAHKMEYKKGNLDGRQF